MATKDNHAALLAEAFAVFNQTSGQLEGAYRELQGQVVDLNRELDSRKRLAAVGEVAATLAHQLRTPLASALLYLEPVEQGSLDPSATVRYAGKTRARLRQIESLINDMLVFTRGGRDGADTITARALLDAAHQVLEPQLGQAELIITDDSGGVVLRGNREALVGAIVNLVNNAIQAAGPQAQVVVHARCTGTAVDIAVSDNGPGIESGARSHLFEPFFTTRSNGTGLGLAVVKSVVEAHDGTVSTQTSPLGGATFVLQLPIAEIRAPLPSDTHYKEMYA